MKLLMISGDRALTEGKRGAFYNTLEEFHKHWDRIDIICPKSNTRNLPPQPLNLFGNVFIHPSPWPLIFQPLWILKKGKLIYKEQKFNLVTVHEYPPFYNGIGARLLWNKIKVPYILEIMHIPGHPKSGSFKESFYKNLMRWFIKCDSLRAEKIRVINKNQTPPFLIKNGIPANKIFYIPAFYIDLNVFYPKELEKEYDLIFVGRLAENKGINLFLETALQLGVRTVIVGDGPLKEKIKKIKGHKLGNKITLKGWVENSEEVAELLNRSRTLIMPSYNEGGPRVVLEAMACGVPVLATPVGVVPDIIKDGESGRVIDWDAEDITRKAERILSDKDEYSKYYFAGLEIVKQFEKKAAIKNYAEKLRSLI